ncbi:hypothetical protein B0H16DRAFT_1744929 [Mycena metata]|uniref:Ribonuclease H1 N-terminal domain-containing protein n=1 Tax=Mycena metata TaxID=1033252 RepID=A0AAD7MD55_9AGAR|nr:hypothetical protein B0H16DRAFT_1744929 [Mycena metata]
MTSPPPTYYDDDDAELLALLSSLNVRDVDPVEPVNSQPPTPATNSPLTPTRLAPARYSFHSPVKTGVTDTWAHAAAETQGVSGATPQRLFKPSKSRVKKRGYAVFFGLLPGVYQQWSEAEPLVKGVSGSLYQGYSTFDQAVEAYTYARQHGWTRTLPSSPLGVTTASPISRLPEPAGLVGGPNPLHGENAVTSLWYVVYCGITPASSVLSIRSAYPARSTIRVAVKA